MARGKVAQFINRNIVAIVMIPTLIGIHWGWTKIQKVDVFVSKEERKDLPIVLGAKYLGEQLEEKITSLKSGDPNVADK